MIRGGLRHHPDRRNLSGDDQIAPSCGLDFIDRDAGCDLAQCHAFLCDLEQSEIGGDEIDDTARGRWNCTAFDEARLTISGLVLHRDKDVFGAGRQIHRPANAAALLAGHLPVREIAILRNLISAEHCNIDPAAAD